MWLQWGHGEFAVENPAGTIQRREPDDPLQWGHGEFAVENGEADESGEIERGGLLQWGHGEFAVENGTAASTIESIGVASMGPRRIRRGEREAARGSGDRDAGALQWGHGEFAVENAICKS